MPTSPNKNPQKNPETNPQIQESPRLQQKNIFWELYGDFFGIHIHKKNTSANPRIFARGQH
jgi:hypothetical protein